MRGARLIGGAFIVASLGVMGLATGGALAASSNPQKALSTRLGSTTCGHFESLSKSRQNRLVRRLIQAAPGGTLATIPAATGGGNSNSVIDATSTSKAPLRASDITAACQASTGASTVRDAYTKFALGGGASSGQQ